MRRLRVGRLGGCLVGMSFLAGCLPGRDNPSDPSNAPRAVLSFADATAAGGTCLAPVSVGPPSVLEIERGRCLGLVGTGSFDPQDPVSALSFRFDLVTSSNQDPATSGAPPLAQTTGQPVAVLDPVAVRALPVETVMTLELTVADTAGRKARTQAQLVVHNELPSGPHIPVRAVAAGGPPWAPGTNWIVPLGVPISDADGDPLTSVCWDRPEGTVCSASTPPNPFDPAFVLTVPPTPGEVVATLRASDGAGNTTLGRSVVRVRPPSTWTQGGVGGSLQRVDVGRRDFAVTGQNVLGLLPVRNGQGALTHVLLLEQAVAGGANSLHTRSWPNFTGGSDAAPITSSPAGAAVSPDGSAAYIAVNVGNSTGIQLFPYSLSNGTLTAGTPSAVIPLTTEGQAGSNPVASVDAAGHIWVSQLQSGVDEVDAAGNVLGSWADPASGGRVFAIRPRPGTQETWFVRTPQVEVSAAPVTLHRIAGGVETVFAAGLGHAFDFAWVDGNSFWIGLDSGMALVRGDELVAGASFAAATTLTAPPASMVQLAVDPATQDVWGFSFQTFSVYRVAIDGTVLTQVPTSGFGGASFIDDAGTAWWADPTLGRVVASEVPAPRPVASTSTSPLLQGGTGDGAGGLWGAVEPFLVPSLLEHVAYDGTPLATLDHAVVTSGGAIAPLPSSMDTLRLEPGGSLAWVIAHNLNSTTFPPPDQLITFDLSQPVPVETVVVGTAAALHFSAPLLEPSAPTPGSVPFLWTALGGSPGSIGKLTPAGAFTPLVTLSANERQQLRAVRSLRSNSLCTASIDNTAFRSLWITSAGTVTTLASATVTANSILLGAAVSPDSGGTGDLCWSVQEPPPSTNCVFTTNVISAYTPAGTLTASSTVSPPGEVQSIKPVDRFHVWAIVERCDANSNHTFDLDYIVNVNGTGTTLQRLQVEASSGFSFLDDEVANANTIFPYP